MAFSAVLTGTARSCTLTSGSNSMVVSSATGLVVGATIQGTGVPTGSRIGTISGTTVTMVTASGTASNATAGGAQNLIFSSVYGSVLTITLSASGDYATPQNIYNAGFGVMQNNIATRELFFPGSLLVRWSNIVSGAVFDFLNWSLEFGNGGYFRFQESSIEGELRGGYLVNGTQFIKTVGPTFYAYNWNNSGAGGSSIFENLSGTTNQGLFRMHNMRMVEVSGSNAAPTFNSARMTMVVENMVLDYQNDSAGANAGIGAAFGNVKNTYLVKTNAGIGATNSTNFATFDGINYVGNYQSTPQHKFSLPDGYTLDGYAPQVLSTQFLGGFNSATLETYSNINLSTAGWGLDDLKTRYQRYSGPITLKFPRTVSFEFNDSSATNLTGITLYIRSGSTSIVNQVQAGDYSAPTQALNLIWNNGVTSYRTCTSFIDTINQVAQVRKYGYIQQTTSYSLNLSSYSQPFFMLDDVSLSGISEATASALTSINLDFNNKVVTVVANANYDEINARIAWALAQTTGSMFTDPRSITGTDNVLASGWTVLVMPGVTLSSGTKITYMYSDTFKPLSLADTPYLFNSSGVLQSTGVLLTTTVLGAQDTYTGAGLITAIYANAIGTSTKLELRGVTNGASSYVGNNSTAATIFFEANSSIDTKTIYFPPGSTGLEVLVARELYGYQRVQEVIPLSAGLVWYQFVDIEDVGISVPAKATVAAYTTLNNPDKVYDYTAYKRLEEAYIKFGQITIRDGSSLLITPYSMKVNHNATSVYSIVGDVITIKSSSYEVGTKYTKTVTAPPDTVTAHTNEIITCPIEDANGDSQLTISGGDGNYELWKITMATPTDNYAAGTLLATVGTGIYRFLGLAGFDIVGRDTNSGIRRRTSMAKGSYEQKFYVGDQIQLAQQPEVLEILTNIEIMQVDIDAIKGTGFLTSTDSLEAISTSLGAVSLATTNMPLNVWGYTTRTLTSEGASGATLAEIEGSLILAKKSQIDSLGTPMQSSEYVAPDNVKIGQIKTKVDSLQNADLSTLPTLAQMEDSTILAKQLSVLEIGSPLQAANYVEPDNLSIGQIKAKTDTLENYDDTILIDKIDSIGASVGELDTSDLAKETTAQAAKKAAKLAAALSA